MRGVAAVLTVGVLLFGLAESTLSYDCATHMYIGSQTLDIWENFDSDFHTLITNPNDSYLRMYTRKFYYIGLTLPDMLLDSTQVAIRVFLDAVHGIRDYIDYSHPFYIQDHTYNNIQTPIIFNDSTPNKNLEKLRAMAVWARDNIPAEKQYQRALIYGAYMHVVHDLYAHMMLQPSRFGYGFAIEADSAHTDDILYWPEIYHEFFTATDIPNWSFVRTYVYRAKFAKEGIDDPEIDIYTAASSNWGWVQFYSAYNDAGAYESGWQDHDYSPVSRFVQAANAVGYDVDNLTQERLEAYLHGWGLMMFLQYGYRNDFSDQGGIFAHPNWTPATIFDFVGDTGYELGGLTLCDIPILCDLLDVYVWETVFSIMNYDVLEKILQFFGVLAELPGGDEPWPFYFESTEGLDSLWACVPDEDRPALEHY